MAIPELHSISCWSASLYIILYNHIRSSFFTLKLHLNIRIFNKRTGILDYHREGFPWPARPFKHTESNVFKHTFKSTDGRGVSYYLWVLVVNVVTLYIYNYIYTCPLVAKSYKVQQTVPSMLIYLKNLIVPHSKACCFPDLSSCSMFNSC